MTHPSPLSLREAAQQLVDDVPPISSAWANCRLVPIKYVEALRLALSQEAASPLTAPVASEQIVADVLAAPTDLAASIRTLRTKLMHYSLGSCRCLTKSPDAQYHDQQCPWRLTQEIEDVLQRCAPLATPPQTPSPVASEREALPTGVKLDQEDVAAMLDEAQREAYAEGRADQREADEVNVLMLLDLCDERCAVADGFINTTDVRELVGFFRDEAAARAAVGAAPNPEAPHD